MQVMRHCRELCALDFETKEEGQVSDKFIDFLIQTTHVLSYVNCCGHLEITPKAVAAFSRRYPEVVLLSDETDEELKEALAP